MHTSHQPRPHGLRGRARFLIATATVLAITGCGSTTPDTSSAIGPEEFADRAISAALKANTLHMRIDSGGDSIRADIVLNDESDMLASDLSMSTLQPLLVRWKNGRVYVKDKSLARGWVAADPTDPRDPVGAQFGYVRTLNPVTLVKDARETAIALERVGTEVVDGTNTTHYSMTLDPELATSGSTINAEGLRAQGHRGKLVYEFWIDENDLMIKVTFDVAGRTDRVHMSEWGTPKDVDAPIKARTTAELGMLESS